MWLALTLAVVVLIEFVIKKL